MMNKQPFNLVTKLGNFSVTLVTLVTFSVTTVTKLLRSYQLNIYSYRGYNNIVTKLLNIYPISSLLYYFNNIGKTRLIRSLFIFYIVCERLCKNLGNLVTETFKAKYTIS